MRVVQQKIPQKLVKRLVVILDLLDSIADISDPSTPTSWAYFKLKEGSIGISQFAQLTGLHRKTVSSILNGHSSITADSALAISEVLETTPELWLNLQNKIDLFKAQQKRQIKMEANPSL